MGNKLVKAMYAEYLANWITNGSLINRDKISSLGLKAIFNEFLTKPYVTRAWCIIKVPVQYKNNFSEGIKSEMFKAFPKVKTIIHTYNMPVNVDINNRLFLSQFNKATTMFEAYAQAYNELHMDEKLTGRVIRDENGHSYRISKEDLLRMKEQFDSYQYVYKQVSDGSYFTETYYFIQASAKKSKELERYGKRLASLLQGGKSESKFVFTEIKGDIGKYLLNFCPASYIQDASTKVSPMLFSEENLAHQMPYRTKGLIDGKGFLIANDWQTKLPFIWNPLESSSAQVCLIAGLTGCGKTYIAFGIAQQFVGFGIHASAIDIKGNEWVKMAPFIPTKIISCGDLNPCFVNTLRLDDLEATAENCNDLFMNAVNGTVMLLSIMTSLQPNEGNAADLTRILNKAVLKLYSKHEVIQDNPSTFYRTKDLWYDEILDIVDDLKSTASYSDNAKKICDLIRSRCSEFFLSEGRYSSLFKNELTISDILETPMVVYSFDKNANGELDLLDSLKVFMVQFLDSKKQELRKMKGLHTVAFYEELQRCNSSSDILKFISSRVTGSRSSNVTIFLLLNSISVLSSPGFEQIKSNITSKFIGLLNSDDIKTLIDHYDCKPIEYYLNLINDPNKSGYENCFAVQYNTGLHTDSLLIKAVFPDYMWKQFNTRDRMDFS